jgi:RHS repeat-associated protein
VVGLTDAADGSLAAVYEYSPFGELVAAEGPAANANPFRFSTKYFDAETGLYYYGYRYYAPKIQRWTSRDPLNEAGGVNLYAFVGNDPVNKVDPLGLSSQTTVSARDIEGLVPLIATQRRSFCGRCHGDVFEGGRVNVATGLYKGPITSQQLAEIIGSNPSLDPRVHGGMRMISGGMEAALGYLALAAPDPTMATKVFGWAAAGHGVDLFVHGWRQLMTGEGGQTFTSQGIEAVASKVPYIDDPHLYAERMDALLSLTTTFGTSAAASLPATGPRMLTQHWLSVPAEAAVVEAATGVRSANLSITHIFRSSYR